MKSVDWRAAGRFEQLLVREEHPESPEQIDFLVDLRRSVDWPTSEICEAFSIFHATKRELVLRLFYHQLYLHLERGDRCCVYFLVDREGQEGLFKLAGLTRAQVLLDFYALEKTNFDLNQLTLQKEENEFSLEQLVAARHSNRKTFVRIFSDFLTWDGRLLDEIFLSIGPCLQVFHILHSAELTLPFAKDFNYGDDPGSPLRDHSGDFLFSGERFKKELRSWLDSFEKKVADIGGLYLLASDQTPIESYLYQLGKLIYEFPSSILAYHRLLSLASVVSLLMWWIVRLKKRRFWLPLLAILNKTSQKKRRFILSRPPLFLFCPFFY